jgi:hypothetical protein
MWLAQHRHIRANRGAMLRNQLPGGCFVARLLVTTRQSASPPFASHCDPNEDMWTPRTSMNTFPVASALPP